MIWIYLWRRSYRCQLESENQAWKTEDVFLFEMTAFHSGPWPKKSHSLDNFNYKPLKTNMIMEHPKSSFQYDLIHPTKRNIKKLQNWVYVVQLVTEFYGRFIHVRHVLAAFEANAAMTLRSFSSLTTWFLENWVYFGENLKNWSLGDDLKRYFPFKGMEVIDGWIFFLWLIDGSHVPSSSVDVVWNLPILAEANKMWIRHAIWVLPKIGVPQNGCFIMENPIKIHNLGVPLVLETPI